MRVLILPVSGGSFPAQAGVLRDHLNNEYKPDVMLSTSGGAVISYLLASARFDNEKLTETLGHLNSNLLLRSWWPRPLSFMPSWMIGMFRGFIYQTGDGAKRFFNTYCSLDNVNNCEIWTGTYNQSLHKAHFFCNIDSEHSVINPRLFKEEAYSCMPLTYLNYDLEKLIKAVVASASVPTLVPPQIIDSDYYCDGGVLYASPLTPMTDVISQLQDSNGLHLDYVSGFDMDSKAQRTLSPSTKNGIIQVGSKTVSSMINSLCLQDRLNGIKMIYQGHRDQGGTSDIFREEGKVTKENIEEIERRRKEYSRSMLELYPSSDFKPLSLTSFNGNDVIFASNEAWKRSQYRFWYVR
jgi:Predicted esterase of the alpha-beta hydrolase superfamily